MAKGLGRGLSSLIPRKSDRSEEYKNSEEKSENQKGISEIETGRIFPNPNQPRKVFSENEINDLSESIKEYGIIQPVVVSRKGDNFELIVGERRLRASILAGLKKIPAIIRDMDEQRKLEVALVENLQREDLNPIERAEAYKRLMIEFNLTVEEVARKMGISRPVISNNLRLLNSSLEMKEAVISGKITETHLVNLMGIEDENKRKIFFNEIIRNKWNIGKTRNELRKAGGTKEARIKINYADKDREKSLRDFFGARVEIRRGTRINKIIIDFFSDKELDEMVEKISGLNI